MLPATFSPLIQDVEDIYSDKDPSTKTYENNYEFDGNKITILFTRIWEVEKTCGADQYGTAQVKMLTRDQSLEGQIRKIIQAPKYLTMTGRVPVVREINFS